MVRASDRSRHRIVMAAVGLFGLAAPALAQDEASIRTGQRAYSATAVCASCHGWAGDGEGDPRAPNGPSLRATTLTRDQIREVVLCGRPGTQMPYHDRNAYTDDRCYGADREALGDQVPPAGKFLREAQVDALLDYLEARVVGHGAITREECVAYWGDGAAVCGQYQ